MKIEYVYFHSRSKGADEKYLSNFSDAVPIPYKGVVFPSIENAFQAAKYLYSSRTDRFATIANMTPVQARTAGSKSGMKKVGAVLDVSKWNEMNTGIMRALIRIRITHDHRFRRLLKDARDHNIKLLHYEGGAEPYWGGYFKGSKKSLDAFYGRNMLGEIMMHASLSRWEDV